MKIIFPLMLVVIGGIFFTSSFSVYAQEQEFKGTIGKTLADSEDYWATKSGFPFPQSSHWLTVGRTGATVKSDAVGRLWKCV
jgi:hypothetical protein